MNINIHAIPIIGWIVSFVANASTAVPFWFFWTYVGIGGKYFSFLPGEWQAIPFFDCIWIFVCMEVVRSVFYPRAVQSNTNKTGN